MKMITATEANRDFSKLLDRVAEGEAIGITKHGKIVATLRPAQETSAHREELKRQHISELRARKPFAHVTSRGTRDELYED
ncbi:MAG: type II toxin-antitoxin system prevent-host-death family antitoxin [Rhizobiales bacterium]|nr:type II toxin-antitoxin system prevent-host-death family antitoxin [Hyphomicrobiales bacterium]